MASLMTTAEISSAIPAMVKSVVGSATLSASDVTFHTQPENSVPEDLTDAFGLIDASIRKFQDSVRPCGVRFGSEVFLLGA